MRTAYFCPYCNLYTSNPAIERKTINYNINGLDIPIETNIIKCNRCGNEIIDEEQKNVDIHKAIDRYYSY